MEFFLLPKTYFCACEIRHESNDDDDDDVYEKGKERESEQKNVINGFIEDKSWKNVPTRIFFYLDIWHSTYNNKDDLQNGLFIRDSRNVSMYTAWYTHTCSRTLCTCARV